MIIFMTLLIANYGIAQYAETTINNQNLLSKEIETLVSISKTDDVKSINRFITENECFFINNCPLIIAELTDSQKKTFIQYCVLKNIDILSDLGNDICIMPTLYQLRDIS